MSADYNMPDGRKFEVLRALAKMSQAKAAKLLGVHQPAIAHMDVSTKFHKETIQKICPLFGITPEIFEALAHYPLWQLFQFYKTREANDFSNQHTKSEGTPGGGSYRETPRPEKKGQ